jgi:ATP-dependent exoDNAse (exonuclease V) beta subunit
LWEALRQKSADFVDARELLRSLLAMADYTTPHRFLETVLTGPIEGRRKLYSRLGLAARGAIARTVCDLISDNRFSALFGPGSLAEAPIAATLPDGRVIAGAVDRLLIEPERILVVDYKTGRAPQHQDDIPEAHRLQMQAYAEALSVIFPGRDIESALLYTAVARFFTVGS